MCSHVIKWTYNNKIIKFVIDTYKILAPYAKYNYNFSTHIRHAVVLNILENCTIPVKCVESHTEIDNFVVQLKYSVFLCRLPFQLSENLNKYY